MDFKINYSPDAYELWGYLIPGVLTLALMWRFFGDRLINLDGSVTEGILCFMVILFAAYVIGLFLHWSSTKVFRIFCDVTYPVSKGRDDDTYGIPFTDRLLQEVVSHYNLDKQTEQLLPRGVCLARCLYELCYHSEPVLKNPLVPIYLARATMLRNLTLVFGLFLSLYLLSILSIEFASAPFDFFRGERCLGLFLSSLLAVAFYKEACRVTKVLYRTVFLTWWECYHREGKDQSE